MGPCDLNKYQSINLFINDQFYFKLVPESFVIDIGMRGKCFIPFMFNDDDTFVLGQPFFRNFYTVFDDTKGIVGMGPSVNFLHTSIVQGVVPNDELPQPGKEAKERNRENMKKVPDGSNPLDMITYYFSKVSDFFLGTKTETKPASGTDLQTIGVIIVVCLLGLCCCAAAIYGII
jgi:hypothetical protein